MPIKVFLLMSLGSAWKSAAKSNEKLVNQKYATLFLSWMPFSTWSGSEFYVYQSDFWTKLGYFGQSECCAYSHKLFQRWRRKVCLCPLYNYVSCIFLVQMFLLFCHCGNLFVPNFCLFVWFLFHSLSLLISEKLSK